MKQHPIVAVLDSLSRDAAVLQDRNTTNEQRAQARARFEANMRTLGIDYVDAQKWAKAVAA